MLCKSNLAQRRFMIRMVVAAGFCLLFAAVAALAFHHGHLSGALAYPVAALPALPIIAALVGTGAYLTDETDEFQRNLLVQSLLGGIGATLASTTIWGYLEDFARAPHLDLTLVYPLFWLFVVLSYPVVRLRYR
jgi:hypothetical protein